MDNPKPAKRGMSMAGKNAVSGYLFILPFLIGFIVFMAFPFVEAIQMSFSSVTLDVQNSTFIMEWVGLTHFERMFLIEPDFLPMLVEELLGMAFLVPAVLVFSLFIAVLLNRKFAGRGFVRSVFFLPVILASGVLVGIETNNTLLDAIAAQLEEQSALKAGVTGVIERLLDEIWGAVGVGDYIQYVLDVINQIYYIAMASGIQILIFLAGLQTINPSIFEAASIEGATGWENFWKITFPMISPMILVVVVYSIIDYMVRTDSQVMEEVLKSIEQFVEYGYGSAMAMVYFAIIAVILGILAFIISRLVYYYD